MNKINIKLGKPADWPAITTLLQQSGLPLAGLTDHLHHTLVARAGSKIVGCAALERYGSYALLRSVAVAAEARGNGLGQQLIEAALALARQERVEAIYLLTETAAGFFPRFGFRPVERNQVPSPVHQSIEFTTACPASALAMELVMHQPAAAEMPPNEWGLGKGEV